MAFNRPIKPRSASQYDNREHGRRESSMPPDDCTINAKLCRSNLMRLKFNEGPMVFRPWPALDPQNPTELLPGRRSVESHGITDFMVRIAACKYTGLNDPGCEKVTFLLYEPFNEHSAKKTNPFRVLYFACKQAHDAGEFATGGAWDSKWNKILKGGKGHGAELSPPSAVWFSQGTLYANGNKDYTGGDRDTPMGLHEDDDLVVVQLSDTAGSNFLDFIDKPKADYDGVDEETKPWLAFKYGDPVGVTNAATGGVDGGLILTFFNPSKNKLQLPHMSWNGEMKKEGPMGYEVGVSRTFKGADKLVYRADMDKKMADRVRGLWQFWFADKETHQAGLLYFPSIEEQYVRLAKAFKPVPRMLEFAWQDQDGAMSDDVIGILRERRSAVVPGDVDDEQQEQPQGRSQPRKPRTDPTQQVAEEPAVDEFSEPGDVAVAGDPAAADEFSEPGEAVESTEPVETAATGAGDFEEDAGAAAEELATEEAVAEEGAEAAEAAAAAVEEDPFAIEGEEVPGTEAAAESPVGDEDTFPDDKTAAAAAGDVEADPFTVEEAADTDNEPAGDEFEEDAPVAAPAATPARRPAARPATPAAAPVAAASAPRAPRAAAGTAPATKSPVTAGDVKKEAEMRASLEAAKARAVQRASAPAAAPAATAAAKPAAASKPVAASAPVKPPAAAGKPAVAAGKPAAAQPAKPAAVAPKSTAAAGKPAAAPAKPAAAPVKPVAAGKHVKK